MTRVVVCYIPGIHQGYLNLFEQYPGHLRLLGPELVAEIPRLDRDLRALPVGLVATMVRSLGRMQTVGIIGNPADLRLFGPETEFVLPDEDISHHFAELHLAGCNVTFVSIFLRWDRQMSMLKSAVPAGRCITNDELARELIGVAQAATARSTDWWRQVGAVVARDGSPLMAAYNHPLVASDYTLGLFGDPRSNFDAGEFIETAKSIHAEASLIARAARGGIVLDGADLYVTTFPCANCAKLVAEAGFCRVYYRDGYSLLDAADVLDAAGVELILVQMETPSAITG